MDLPAVEWTFQRRLEALRATKLRHTLEKQKVVGAMDHDDHALTLPPPERRKIVQTMNSSGMPITDCLLEGFQPRSNHPSGGFFGPRACGENFGRLLRAHPIYVDPMSSLAGGYMVNFMSYRQVHWNPDFAFDEFQADIEKYKLLPGIGAPVGFECLELFRRWRQTGQIEIKAASEHSFGSDGGGSQLCLFQARQYEGIDRITNPSLMGSQIELRHNRITAGLKRPALISSISFTT